MQKIGTSAKGFIKQRGLAVNVNTDARGCFSANFTTKPYWREAQIVKRKAQIVKRKCFSISGMQYGLTTMFLLHFIKKIGYR